MDVYLLDTNIILMYPQILAYDTKLIIPNTVLQEIQAKAKKNTNVNSILKIIKDNKSHIQIKKADTLKREEIPSDFTGLSEVDISIATLSKNYKDGHVSEQVFVATHDKLLSEYLKNIGVNSLDLVELKSKIKDRPKSIATQKRTNRIRILELSNLIISIVASVLTTLGVNTAIIYSVLSKINVWGTLILIPITGILLYFIREKFRLFYGLTELLVGCYTALSVFFPTFSYGNLLVSDWLRILGGLYIIVRGMDNTGKGLESTKYIYYWKKIF